MLLVPQVPLPIPDDLATSVRPGSFYGQKPTSSAARDFSSMVNSPVPLASFSNHNAAESLEQGNNAPPPVPEKPTPTAPPQNLEEPSPKHAQRNGLSGSSAKQEDDEGSLIKKPVTLQGLTAEQLGLSPQQSAPVKLQHACAQGRSGGESSTPELNDISGSGLEVSTAPSLSSGSDEGDLTGNADPEAVRSNQLVQKAGRRAPTSPDATAVSKSYARKGDQPEGQPVLSAHVGAERQQDAASTTRSHELAISTPPAPLVGSPDRNSPDSGRSPAASAQTQNSTATSLPPAAQLTSAFASSSIGLHGESTLHIRLHPDELGGMQVNIVRAHDGGASVRIVVERAETLRSLQSDVGHLHQALDRVGLPEHRSVTLHLATPDSGDGHGGAAWSGQASLEGGSDQHRTPHDQSAARTFELGSGDAQADGKVSNIAGSQTNATRRQLTGIDITA